MLGASALPLAAVIAATGVVTLLIWAMTRDIRRRRVQRVSSQG
jgi:hypothetical protein